MGVFGATGGLSTVGGAPPALPSHVTIAPPADDFIARELEAFELSGTVELLVFHEDRVHAPSAATLSLLVAPYRP